MATTSEALSSGSPVCIMAAVPRVPDCRLISCLVSGLRRRNPEARHGAVVAIVSDSSSDGKKNPSFLTAAWHVCCLHHVPFLVLILLSTSRTSVLPLLHLHIYFLSRFQNAICPNFGTGIRFPGQKPQNLITVPKSGFCPGSLTGLGFRDKSLEALVLDGRTGTKYP